MRGFIRALVSLEALHSLYVYSAYSTGGPHVRSASSALQGISHQHCSEDWDDRAGVGLLIRHGCKQFLY